MSFEDLIKGYVEAKIDLNPKFGSVLDELAIEYESFCFYDEFKSVCLDLEMHNKELSEAEIEKIMEKTGFEFLKVEIKGKRFPYGNGEEIDYVYVFEC